MLLNFVKTQELTELNKQFLSANISVVRGVLSTSSQVAKQGIDYNRAVIQSCVCSLATNREQAARVIDEMFMHANEVEDCALNVLQHTSDSALDNTNALFARFEHPRATVGNAVEKNLLESLITISEPALDRLKSTTAQFSELSNKLVTTAALTK